MTAPDRTLYAVSVVVDPTDYYYYGPSYVQAFDLDTGDLIATSPTLGSDSIVWCVAYDYKGSLWGVGSPRNSVGPFDLVQFDASTLDVLNTFAVPCPTDPATANVIPGEAGITFSNNEMFIWAADLVTFTEEAIVSYLPGPTQGSVFAAQRQTGEYAGTPYWVQTPLHGTKPYAFTLGVADGNCVLLKMKLCPGGTPTWAQVAVIGTEAAIPYPEYEFFPLWQWDYAGPVVTAAGIYVLTNVFENNCATINLYDLNDYSLLGSWDISAIGVPAFSFPLTSTNFAVDSIANVAYIATVTFPADDSNDGLGYSYLWSVNLSTGDVAYVTEIPYYCPIFLDPTTGPTPYPSGAALHIPLPTAPVVNCGTPWLRMFQRSDGGGIRMSQVAGSANSPQSIRNYGSGNCSI